MAASSRGGAAEQGATMRITEAGEIYAILGAIVVLVIVTCVVGIAAALRNR